MADEHDHDPHDDKNRTPSRDESTHPEATEHPVAESPSMSPGAIAVATTDPDISRAEDAAWRRHPEATMTVETAGVDEPVMVAPPGARVVALDRRRPTPRNGTRRGHDGASRDRDEDQREAPRERAGAAPPTFWSRYGGVLMSGLVALVCGLAGAWAYMEFFGPSKSDQSATGSKSGDHGAAKGSEISKSKSKPQEKSEGGETGSAEEIPGFTSARDTETLEKQLDHLSERIDRVNQRVDQVNGSANATPPILHTLQVKMTELAREVDDVADLPEQVQRLNHQFEKLREDVRALRDREQPARSSTDENDAGESSATETDATTDAVSAAEATTHAPVLIDFLEPERAIQYGRKLFRGGEYARSLDIFRKLEGVIPNDARVWYLGALACGKATGRWDGEARRSVETGLKREAAGTPSTQQINATLGNLSKAEGGAWLQGYRDRLGHRLSSAKSR